jgi:hypothetical protein
MDKTQEPSNSDWLMLFWEVSFIDAENHKKLIIVCYGGKSYIS